MYYSRDGNTLFGKENQYARLLRVCVFMLFFLFFFVVRTSLNRTQDASVCLRNYRVDGAMFWNQFFIAALRDSEGAVINYVGVQCKACTDSLLSR